MAKFAYNNAKNASTGYTPFELNCGYHLWVSYKKHLDPCSKSKTAEELSFELRNLMAACQQNFHHAQELQKQAHDKGVKPQSYAPSDEVWLSSKHLKTKRNCKLEAKFFGFFQVLHPVGKQAYKVDCPKKGGFMTSFTYPCWNKIPQRKSKWMMRSWISSSRLATIRSIRLMAFEIVRSMPESQQDSYKGSTIWFCGKATLRRRIPRSLYWQSSTFKGLSPPTTRTIQRSQ